MSASELPERCTGKVKWYSVERGYGFIIPDQPVGEDVFVHATALRQSGLVKIDKDQSVEFGIKDNKGRPTAINVAIKA